MAKIGGGGCDDNDAFARVYNNLLLHEYIYYFTPVHANSAQFHRDAFLSHLITQILDTNY